VSETPAEKRARLNQQERAIRDVAALACEVMDEQGVSRAGLARRLCRTASYVDRMLDGEIDMTVRAWSDVFTALDREIRFVDVELLA